MNALAQPDLFLRAIADAPHRDCIDLMAAPICTLGRPGGAPIRFTRGSLSVEVVRPASIHDLDLVLWAVSQLAEAARAGRPVQATVQAPAYDVLKAIGRGVSGRDYIELKAALDRLMGCTVKTTERAPQGQRFAGFHLIEAWTLLEDGDGKARGLSITLPGWIVEAVLAGRVLATDPRYYGIRSGLARTLYRIARRQAGDNATGWAWSMAELHQRTGSVRPLKKFAYDVRQLLSGDDLPEYSFSVYSDQAGGESIHAVRRSKLALDHPGREGRLPRRGRHPA